MLAADVGAGDVAARPDRASRSGPTRWKRMWTGPANQDWKTRSGEFGDRLNCARPSEAGSQHFGGGTRKDYWIGSSCVAL